MRSSAPALQATQAGKPRPAYPTVKRLLSHTLCAINLQNLFECHGILQRRLPQNTESVALPNESESNDIIGWGVPAYVRHLGRMCTHRPSSRSHTHASPGGTTRGMPRCTSGSSMPSATGSRRLGRRAGSEQRGVFWMLWGVLLAPRGDFRVFF